MRQVRLAVLIKQTKYSTESIYSTEGPIQYSTTISNLYGNCNGGTVLCVYLSPELLSNWGGFRHERVLSRFSALCGKHNSISHDTVVYFRTQGTFMRLKLESMLRRVGRKKRDHVLDHSLIFLGVLTLSTNEKLEFAGSMEPVSLYRSIYSVFSPTEGFFV
jgi:hypothetical protein